MKEHDFEAALEWYKQSRCPDYMGIHHDTIIVALTLAKKMQEVTIHAAQGQPDGGVI